MEMSLMTILRPDKISADTNKTHYRSVEILPRKQIKMISSNKFLRRHTFVSGEI